MAILASIEVDDQGSLKVQNFGDALRSLGMTVQATGEKAKGATPNLAAPANALDSLSNGARLAQAALSGLAAYGFKSLLEESGRLAARVEVLGTVMGVVGKNANLSTFEMQVQIGKVKALGITTQEATNSVIQFTQANLKLADTSKIARAAQDLAVISGQNSSDAFKSLTSAIQVQQPMMLRQFGIVTGLDQIYGEYAKTVGKTVKELDAADKKQAFVNKILAEGTKAAGAYEGAMGDVGKQMSSFARYTEEAKLKLGEALLPAMMLVVTVATAMLEWFNKLSPSMQAAATSAMLFAAAVTAIGTAFAGAQLLGIVTLFAKIGPAISVASAAISGGAGVWGAFVALVGGPVTAAIIAVTLLLAAAAAAYVFFTSKNGESTEALVANVAATQGSIDKVEDLVKSVDKAAAAGFRNATETAAYNKQIKALESAIPGSIGQMNKLTGVYEINRDAIERHTLALKANLAQQRIVAESSINDTYQRLAVALTDSEKAAAKYTATSKMLADATARGASPTYLAYLQKHTVLDYEAYQVKEKLVKGIRAEKDAQEALIGGIERGATATQLSTKALGEMKDSIMLLGKTDAETVARLKKSGLMDEYTKLVGGTKIVEVINANHERVKKTVQMTADEIKTLGTEIIDKLSKAEEAAKKKGEAEAKSAAARYKSAVEGFSGEGKSMLTSLKALDEVLGKTKGDQESYLAVLAKGQNAIKQYNALTDEQQKKLGLVNVATAAASTTAKLYAAELAVATAKLDKLTESLALQHEEATRADARGLEELERTTGERIRDQRLANFDKIEAAERAMTERRMSLTMTDVERAVEAEAYRLAMIDKSYKREEMLRNQALAAERAAVDRKAQLAKEEIIIFTQKLELQSNLEIIALTKRAAAASGEDREKLERSIAVEKEIGEAQAVVLADYIEGEHARIEANRVSTQTRLNDVQASNKSITADTAIMYQHQVEDSRIATAQIKQNYDTLMNAVKNYVLGAAQQFMSGLMSIADGTKGFRDVILDTFNTLKNAVMDYVSTMVKTWIAGLFKVKAAQATMKAVDIGGAGAMGDAAGAGGGGGGGGMLGGLGSKSIGSGTMQTTASGALGAAAVGFMAAGIADKYLSKWIDGSQKKGALVGAGAGAGAGAAYGSIVPGIGTGAGALIGGTVGLIKGWMDARKMRKEMETDRDSIIKDAGGLEAFKQAATKAGFEYEKFLNTKSPKEFGEQVKKLKESMDKMQLKNMRDELVKSAGGFEALSRQMQLVGFDAEKLWSTKDIGEYNAEVEKLNELLEKQAERMKGLGTAADGIKSAVAGLTGQLEHGMEQLFDSLGKDAKEKLKKGYEQAQEDGDYKGTQTEYVAEQMKKAKANPKDASLTLSTEELAKYNTLIEKAQKQFSHLGAAAAATFGAVLQETGDINQAMLAVGESLDQLAELQEAFGFSAEGAFGKLLEFRKVVKDNEDIANGLSGITSILNGLGSAGALTAEIFNGMGNDASSMFDTLIERGVSSDQALMMMQPTLQSLWENQKKFGFETDATTQALITQGVEHGLVGDKQQSINQQMLDMLTIIARVLGADVPAAYDTLAERAETAGTRAAAGTKLIRDENGKVVTAVDRTSQAYKDLEEKARRAEQAQRDAAAAGQGNHEPDGSAGQNGGPGFATGGFGSFGRESLVKLHGRELIIPMDRPASGVPAMMMRAAMEAAAAGTGGGTRDRGGNDALASSIDALNATLNELAASGGEGQLSVAPVNMDGKQVSQVVVKYIPSILKKAGI